MVFVEILDEMEHIILEAELPFMPRVGEYISIESDGYFKYYDVCECWIRIKADGKSVACMKVKIDD